MLFAAATSGIAEVKSREIIGLGWFTMETLPAGLARSQREVIGQVLNSEI
jgi:hypothetical protein